MNNYKLQNWIDEVETEITTVKEEGAFIIGSTLSEFMQREYPEARYLVDKLIPLGGVGMIVGKPTSMKSFISLHICICVAKGELVFNHYECEQGNVLLVNLDDSPRDIQRRFHLILEDEKDLPINLITRDDIPDFNIENEKILESLKHKIKENKIKLVIFDTFVKMHRRKEDDAGDMSLIFSKIKQISSVGATIIIIHHTRKGISNRIPELPTSDDIRGSSAIFGELDWEISLSKKIAEDGLVTINAVSLKNKSDKEEGQFGVQVDLLSESNKFTYDASVKIESSDKKVKDNLLEILQQENVEKSFDDISSLITQSTGEDKLRNLLKELIQEGKIIKRKAGHNKFLYSRTFPVSQFDTSIKGEGNYKTEKIEGEYSIDGLTNPETSIYQLLFNNEESKT